jgi:membrane-associated phospholipid phosphatase
VRAFALRKKHETGWVKASLPSSERIARRSPTIIAGGAILLAVALGLVILFREQNKPFGFEAEWMSELVEHRIPALTEVALIFNALGGGIIAILIAPLVIIAGLLVWRRPWAALYFTISVILSAGIVQLLKGLFSRPRPLDILVHPDFGSFPSGHSANAAVVAAVLAIVFRRTWIWAAGAVYAVAMMLSRTYLGAHWISDTVGGFLIGAGVAVIVAAPLALKLRDERERKHPPIWVRAAKPEAKPEPATHVTD